MKTFIIAEAGVNHNGDMTIAKKLIDKSVEARADAIKFQTFQTDKMISRNASKAEYQKKTSNRNESQREMIRKYELDADSHLELYDHCRKRGIKFISSPFDLDSVELLDKMGLLTFKIPSGEITNLPYLRKIGSLKKEIIMSTGMTTLDEIETALKVLETSGTAKNNITVLHCNTEYPTPLKDVNLKAMLTIRDTFNIKVGYSDHTLGIEVPIAAVAIGAAVIEKHFTLDRNLRGPDHSSSLEPDDLKAMVNAIRNIENALGDGIKRPSPSEEKNKTCARKSIVAKKDIKKGEILTEDNLAVKRPETGISPIRWDEVIGSTAIKDWKTDEMIEV